jgi:GH15 family glucan-1,4-alpha-glucosidase
MMACVYLAHSRGMPPAPWAQAAAHEVVDFAASHWSDPDDGIWEVRGGRRHFVYSKVMAWVALDRAIRLANEVGDAEAPIARWQAARDAVRSDVLEHGFDAAKGAFTQAYGAPGLDASVLLIPHVGFLPADDPRMLSTVRAVERELLDGGYVKRSQATGGVDGLAGDEGAFLACTFWLVDNYAMVGRVREAEEVFERLVALRNDLGLLSEEVEPRTGRQIGNFPQAFTHLALVSTAVRLETASARTETAAATRSAAAPPP